MSASLQSFRFAVRSCNCRHVAPRHAPKSVGRGRELSTTASRRKDISADEVEGRISKAEGTSRAAAAYKKIIREVDTSEEAFKARRTAAEEELRHKINARQQPYALPYRPRKLKQTFMNMGEPEPWEEEGMLHDDHDDITALAHGELEQHREMRHYARLAAWEMPLLSKLAKPFEPPTPDMPLRFRYTTYMGEQHPAEKKVVVEFSPADMPHLTELQRDKLKKLTGVRYNPETDIVKMSCEMFESQAQNKRYLGDLVDKILVEARDPTDTFEDVPLDTRHHRFKPKVTFPAEWRITKERRTELIKYRQAAALIDQRRELAGQLVDGIQQIEADLAKQVPVKESLPSMMMASRGSKGQQKKVTIRR